MMHDTALHLPSLAGARQRHPVGEGQDRRHGREADISPVAHQSVDPGTLTTLAEILAERLRQIEQFGHTPEADAALPLCMLPIAAGHKLDAATKAFARELGRAREAMASAIDHAQFRNREPARRKLIQAAALCLAAATRIDHDFADEDAHREHA